MHTHRVGSVVVGAMTEKPLASSLESVDSMKDVADKMYYLDRKKVHLGSGAVVKHDLNLDDLGVGTSVCDARLLRHSDYFMSGSSLVIHVLSFV
jgi:hypothetical protein